MEQATYARRFRYLDAKDVDDSVVNFDGLDVRGHDNEKLGDIEGFIVDSTLGRVYYAVVDAGGWFSSRRLLLPIGHAAIDRHNQVLRVDVTKDALRRYPQFDQNSFNTFSDEDLRSFDQRIAAACCPDEPLDDVSVGAWSLDRRRHYRQPEWWPEGRQERLRPVEAGSPPARDVSTPRSERERELVVAREGDEVSPHHEGRAQPGDVLGLETGGERTGIGDRAEDENKRRRAAERSDRDDEPRRSER